MIWPTLHWIAGGILGLAWLSRIIDAAMGMPHITDIAQPEWDRRPATPDGEPRVSIIVPGRNEEEHVAETLSRLLSLEYSNYEVIAIDDRSTDRTGQIMDKLVSLCGAGAPARESAESRDADWCVSSELTRLAARFKVIHIQDLPPGWLGKTHAMWRASQIATGDWLLFTDADVLFKPDALRRAIAYAETERPITSSCFRA